jgi:hypothetical protein
VLEVGWFWVELNILEWGCFWWQIIITGDEAMIVHRGQKGFRVDFMGRFGLMGIGDGDREGKVGGEFGFEHGIV